jgi:hypothetical protein
VGWQTLYRTAYDLALDDTDVVRAVDELLAHGRERIAFEVARFHYIGHLSDRPDDAHGRRALAYLVAAVESGDRMGTWLGHERDFDLCAIAQQAVVA